ncbi:MAG: hypothetical protein AAF666_09595 [Pseudomonadota bacterium]
MALRFWRQRRRILLVTLAALAAAGLLQNAGHPPHWAIAALALIPLFLLAILFRPQLRLFLTKTAVAAALFSALSTLAVDGYITTILVASFLLLVVFLPSQLWFLDGFRLPWISVSQARKRIALDRETVWQKLFPAPREDHFDPAVAAISQGVDPDVFTFFYATNSYYGDRKIQTRVFDVDDGATFKLRDLSLPDVDDGGPVSVLGHDLQGKDGQTILTLTEGIWRQGIWTAWNGWLDDYLRDHMDRTAALMHDKPDPSIKGQVLRDALTIKD